MAESNIPISETTLARLEEMASWAGVSVAEMLERAVNEQYDRRFWDAVNAGYAALRADPAAWAEIESERRLWDSTLMDGLDAPERWAEEGNTPSPSPEQSS
ncbi:MAG TPA: ribbon-helix-helix domain-containing protein [Gemmataceae bacterium]|nr:ribbon-helix-helix domain-containing protein [Gemmataceae bacterium]